MDKRILIQMIQHVANLSEPLEISDVVNEANSIFNKVQFNKENSDDLHRLIDIDSSLVDSISEIDELPNHIQSVVDYFKRGQSLSSCNLTNIAAAAYFSIVDIYGNHNQFSNDSLQSLGHHLAKFSGEDLIVDEVNKPDGAQFIADNKQGSPDSKYFICQRGFSEKYIYELVIAERTRDIEASHPVYANMFLVMRSRDDSDISSYACSYRFAKPIHIGQIRQHVYKKMNEILNQDHKKLNKDILVKMLNSYKPQEALRQ